jgi:hypothetical protein
MDTNKDDRKIFEMAAAIEQGCTYHLDVAQLEVWMDGKAKTVDFAQFVHTLMNRIHRAELKGILPEK